MTTTILPGDQISLSSLLPNNQAPKQIRGLHQDPHSDRLTSYLGGNLETNPKKRTIAITNTHARYVPAAGDLVIAQFHHSTTDYFHVSILPHYPYAILPQLAFENASKKTRPQLKPGDLVYATVIAANRNMEVELTCVNPSTGKSEPEGLGVINGGTVYDISTGFAGRLLKRQGVIVLDELGEKMAGGKGFEVAVGRNGRVWVDCGSDDEVKASLAVGRCLRETDERSLTEKEQKKLVTRVVTEMGLG